MELERLLNTLTVLGVGYISKEDLALLSGINLDILKLYKKVRSILKANKIDMGDSNDCVWYALIEMCKLYRMHKFKEDEFYEFCDEFNRMYQYRYKSKDLNDIGIFLSYIHYTNINSSFEIDDMDLKVLQDSELFLKYGDEEIWLRADIKYIGEDYIPFFRVSGKFKSQSIGYCVTKDGVLKRYDVTADGFRKFLNDVLERSHELDRVYMPPLSVNKTDIDKYAKIDKLINSEFLRLLRWTSAIDMSQIDIVDYTKIENSVLDINKVMLSLVKTNYYTSKGLINKTISILKNVKTSNKLDKYLKETGDNNCDK